MKNLFSYVLSVLVMHSYEVFGSNYSGLQCVRFGDVILVFSKDDLSIIRDCCSNLSEYQFSLVLKFIDDVETALNK